MATITLLDIETAPKLSYVWNFFKENIGSNQVLENGHIMSCAWKELHDPHVEYSENRGDREDELVEDIIDVLNKSDIVIAHNANRFDLPTINARALINSIHPPSPYKVVDTLAAAKKHFRFDKNSLEHLAKLMGCDPKTTHNEFPGFELWFECLKGNPKAWAEMRKYNIQDVITLEEVYLKMRPWMTSHPNIGVFDEKGVPHCGKCGSRNINFRGYYRTNVGKYHRFRCRECGGWGRDRFTVYPKEKRNQLMVNV